MFGKPCLTDGTSRRTNGSGCTIRPICIPMCYACLALTLDSLRPSESTLGTVACIRWGQGHRLIQTDTVNTQLHRNSQPPRLYSESGVEIKKIQNCNFKAVKCFEARFTIQHTLPNIHLTILKQRNTIVRFQIWNETLMLIPWSQSNHKRILADCY